VTDTGHDSWAGFDLAEPPNDTGAERRILSAMLTWPEAIDAVGDVLLPEHFYMPAHQVLYQTMIVMRAAGLHVDGITVRARLAEDGDLGALGGHHEGAAYLVMLTDALAEPVPAALGSALIVQRLAILRRAQEVFTTALQILHGSDPEDPVRLVGRVTDELDRVVACAADAADPLSGAVTVQSFVTTHREHREPVIPRILHEQDRLVLVARPGEGKTTLLQQIGVRAAAGLHPFRQVRIPPARVLILDFENPRDESQDALERMIGLAACEPGWDPGRLHVWSEPEGLDIAGDPAAAFRLASEIRKVRPRLIVGGPTYKMIEDDADRTHHAAMTRFWDRYRVRYGFALAVETHPPIQQGKVVAYRPAGSSRWLNWPEFGFTIEPATKKDPAGSLRFGTFRRPRIQGRDWPRYLYRGGLFAGGWPWAAGYDGPEEDQ